MSSKIKNLFGIILSILFFICSIPIFQKIYETSKMIIDEEFHIRQGKYYCMGKYNIWDPKITTFPGLYIISIILLPFKLCTTYYLRLISLLGSTLNIFLIWKICILKRNQSTNNFLLNNALETISINLLPPLYFFSFLYYTDIISLTFVLLMFNFWLIKKNFLSFIFGICCILMRQTNIIWICMIFIINSIDELLKIINDLKYKYHINIINIKNVYQILLLNNRKLLKIYIKRLQKNLLGYGILILCFIIFIFINGSIVIGDKTAHQATIHLPQLLYFSLFISFFTLPKFLMNFYHILTIIKLNLIKFIIACIIIGIIVKYNTLVHPYLLADNRHYTFYIWNRLYGKYDLFKYAIIPLYIMNIIYIIENLKYHKFSFQLSFYLCIFIAIALQKLLELRYFIIPFIIFRLNMKSYKTYELILEILFYLIINTITFYIFFTKEIYWTNYEEPQRLIW